MTIIQYILAALLVLLAGAAGVLIGIVTEKDRRHRADLAFLAEFWRFLPEETEEEREAIRKAFQEDQE